MEGYKQLRGLREALGLVSTQFSGDRRYCRCDAEGFE